MNVRGIFKNLELYIPFDATQEFSRVTSMSLSTQISYKKSAIVEKKINVKTNKVLD